MEEKTGTCVVAVCSETSVVRGYCTLHHQEYLEVAEVDEVAAKVEDMEDLGESQSSDEAVHDEAHTNILDLYKFIFQLALDTAPSFPEEKLLALRQTIEAQLLLKGWDFESDCPPLLCRCTTVSLLDGILVRPHLHHWGFCTSCGGCASRRLQQQLKERNAVMAEEEGAGEWPQTLRRGRMLLLLHGNDGTRGGSKISSSESASDAAGQAGAGEEKKDGGADVAVDVDVSEMGFLDRRFASAPVMMLVVDMEGGSVGKKETAVLQQRAAEVLQRAPNHAHIMMVGVRSQPPPKEGSKQSKQQAQWAALCQQTANAQGLIWAGTLQVDDEAMLTPQQAGSHLARALEAQVSYGQGVRMRVFMPSLLEWARAGMLLQERDAIKHEDHNKLKLQVRSMRQRMEKLASSVGQGKEEEAKGEVPPLPPQGGQVVSLWEGVAPGPRKDLTNDILFELQRERGSLEWSRVKAGGAAAASPLPFVIPALGPLAFVGDTSDDDPLSQMPVEGRRAFRQYTTLELAGHALSSVQGLAGLTFTRLDFSYNRITTVALDVPALQYLDLSFNPITVLPKGWGLVKFAKKLQVLNLKGCRLSGHLASAVEGLSVLPKLTSLDLSGNAFNWDRSFRLAAAALLGHSMPMLQTLDLSDNPFYLRMAPNEPAGWRHMLADQLQCLLSLDGLPVTKQGGQSGEEEALHVQRQVVAILRLRNEQSDAGLLAEHGRFAKEMETARDTPIPKNFAHTMAAKLHKLVVMGNKRRAFLALRSYRLDLRLAIGRQQLQRLNKILIKVEGKSGSEAALRNAFAHWRYCRAVPSFWTHTYSRKVLPSLLLCLRGWQQWRRQRAAGLMVKAFGNSVKRRLEAALAQWARADILFRVQRKEEALKLLKSNTAALAVRAQTATEHCQALRLSSLADAARDNAALLEYQRLHNHLMVAQRECQHYRLAAESSRMKLRTLAARQNTGLFCLGPDMEDIMASRGVNDLSRDDDPDQEFLKEELARWEVAEM